MLTDHAQVAAGGQDLQAGDAVDLGGEDAHIPGGRVHHIDPVVPAGQVDRNAAATGGDLGFIPENSLQGDKQAYDAINRLKPGQFTPPLPAAGPTG